MQTWPDFYDPDLYEEEVGPGLRVGDAYADLLSGSHLSIVEYGCGPGQILLRLAREGHEVTGIDRSAAMVERARLRAGEATPDIANRVTVLHGDAISSLVDAPVDAILLTNELVLHVLEGPTLLEMLGEAARILKPKGRLILDLPFVDFSLLATASDESSEKEFSRGYFPRINGTTLCVRERVVFDPNTWHKQMTFRYETIDANGKGIGVEFRQLIQRVWTLQEITFALEYAGFRTPKVNVIEGFDGRYFVTAQTEG